MRKYQFLTMVVFACSMLSASALEYRDGTVAFSNNDVRKAARIWTKLAENGDAISQMALGGLYADDLRNWKHDYAKSVYWFKKCEPTTIVCSLKLAKAYELGNGVEKDLEHAESLYLKVAHTDINYPDGIVEARLALGKLSLTGKLPAHERSDAEKWIRPVANIGNHDAQFWMGMICQGREPESGTNLVEAGKWFWLASADAGATGIMSKDAIKRLEKKLTLPERQDAKMAAVSWMPQPVDSLDMLRLSER